MNRFLSFVLLVSFPYSLFAQETAQWRGDNRDGKYNETGLLKSWPENGPTMLWHFDELGDGHASAAVTSEIIYNNPDKSSYQYEVKKNRPPETGIPTGADNNFF